MAVYYASTQYRKIGRHVNPFEIRKWIQPVHSKSQLGRNPKLDFELPSLVSVISVSAPVLLLSSALNSFLIGFGVWAGYSWTHNTIEGTDPKDNLAIFITFLVGLVVSYSVYGLSNFGSTELNMMRRLIDVAGPANVLSGTMGIPQPRLHQHSGTHVPRMEAAQTPLAYNVEVSKSLQELVELRRKTAEVDKRITTLLERVLESEKRDQSSYGGDSSTSNVV